MMPSHVTLPLEDIVALLERSLVCPKCGGSTRSPEHWRQGCEWRAKR